jgi:hypothetical protein
VWRAGTAAQNGGEAPAPQAQCATPLGLTLCDQLGHAVLRPSSQRAIPLQTGRIEVPALDAQPW